MSLFSGFSSDLPQFLKELSDNNNDTWFSAHRERFQGMCYGPSLEFMKCLGQRMQSYDPVHFVGDDPAMNWVEMTRDGAMASADNAAYDPFVHLRFPVKSDGEQSLNMHLVFASGGMGVGCGIRNFDANQLTRYQYALQDKTVFNEFEEALRTAKLSDCHLENLNGKRAVKELEGDAFQTPYHYQTGILLRNRNEAYDEAFFTSECVDMIDARLRNLLPIQKWLETNVL